MRNNLITLMARKSERERRRITANLVAIELKHKGISRNSVYAFASDGMREYPQRFLLALMEYFDCGIEDLFVVEEESDLVVPEAPAR